MVDAQRVMELYVDDIFQENFTLDVLNLENLNKLFLSRRVADCRKQDTETPDTMKGGKSLPSERLSVF